jgi:predicted porin
MFMNKKALAVAISSALAVPMAAQAVSFNLSGQVNRAIMFADDGEASDIFFVDNTASNTRFRLTGSEDMGNGTTVGFNLEWASSVNSNDYVQIKDAGDNSLQASALNQRRNEVWFSGNWGKVSLGQGPTASDSMGDADLSGTWLADYSTPASWGGALLYRTGTNGTASTNSVFGNNSYFDGHSRRARIRYDAPSFGPLSLSVDMSQNNTWGTKAYLYTSLGGGDLSAHLGYAHGDNRFNRSDFGGSASFLFSQGTNITIGLQERDFVANGRDTATHYSVKLGHRWGNNAVSISYQQTDDLSANSSEANAIGIGFTHAIPKPGVELYAGYRHNSLEDDGTGNGNFEDIDVFYMGTRVKFN